LAKTSASHTEITLPFLHGAPGIDDPASPGTAKHLLDILACNRYRDHERLPMETRLTSPDKPVPELKEIAR